MHSDLGPVRDRIFHQLYSLLFEGVMMFDFGQAVSNDAFSCLTKQDYYRDLELDRAY